MLKAVQGQAGLEKGAHLVWLALAGGEAWGIRVVREATVEVTAEPRSWGLPWVHGPPKDRSPRVGRLGLERLQHLPRP